MGRCDVCDAAVEHPFPCQRCERSFCSDHRLPENHDCPAFDRGATPLSGDGPSVRDRRGTFRRRVDRVRAKETSKRESRIDERDDGGASGETAVLTCAECGASVASLATCEDCGDAYCSDCVDDHDSCQTAQREREKQEDQAPAGGVVARMRDAVLGVF